VSAYCEINQNSATTLRQTAEEAGKKQKNKWLPLTDELDTPCHTPQRDHFSLPTERGYQLCFGGMTVTEK